MYCIVFVENIFAALFKHALYNVYAILIIITRMSIHIPCPGPSLHRHDTYTLYTHTVRICTHTHYLCMCVYAAHACSHSIIIYQHHQNKYLQYKIKLQTHNVIPWLIGIAWAWKVTENIYIGTIIVNYTYSTIYVFLV